MPKAIYNSKTGMIGCVLIQAGLGGNPRISQMFDNDDWELAPVEGQALMDATIEQWQFVADMTREQRVERWNLYS